jgi:hypothetical protein
MLTISVVAFIFCAPARQACCSLRRTKTSAPIRQARTQRLKQRVRYSAFWTQSISWAGRGEKECTATRRTITLRSWILWTDSFVTSASGRTSGMVTGQRGTSKGSCTRICTNCCAQVPAGCQCFSTVILEWIHKVIIRIYKMRWSRKGQTNTG